MSAAVRKSCRTILAIADVPAFRDAPVAESSARGSTQQQTVFPLRADGQRESSRSRGELRVGATPPSCPPDRRLYSAPLRSTRAAIDGRHMPHRFRTPVERKPLNVGVA